MCILSYTYSGNAVYILFSFSGLSESVVVCVFVDRNTSASERKKDQ